MDADAVAARLRAPFPAEAIGKLPKVTCGACAKRECKAHKPSKCEECHGYLTPAHAHKDYVGHAYVRERLLDVDPNWTWEPFALDNFGLPAIAEGVLWIRLTVAGRTVIGAGDAPGKRGGLAVKEMIGDAIRNAAMSLGVALDMWKKDPPAPQSDEEQRENTAPPQQTPAQHAAELRGQIAVLARAKFGHDASRAAAEFTQWSMGGDIRTADNDTLAAYLKHLQNTKAPA